MSVASGTSLWSPRQWPTWVGVSCCWLLARLPIRAHPTIGRLVGRCLRLVLPRRARIAESNIELAFPDLSGSERAALVVAVFDSLGISVLEMVSVFFGAIDRFRPHFHIRNAEALRRAESEGRGVILAGTHFGPLELCGALLASEIPFDIVYRPSRNKVVDRLMLTARERRYGQVLPVRSLSAVIRRVRAGKIVWFAVDQDMGHAGSVFVPLMGVESATITSVSKLARRTGAAVVFMSQFRDASALKWQLELEVVEGYPTADPKADAIRLNALVEREIREHPEQFYWVHRRFKSLRGGKRREYQTGR